MNLVSHLFPLGWQHYLLGGLLIGAGVALLFLFTGRVGGMSSVFSSTWSYVVQRPYFSKHVTPAHAVGGWCMPPG